MLSRSAAVTTTEGFSAPDQPREVHAGIDMGRVGARTSSACEVFAGQPGISAARKSEA